MNKFLKTMVALTFCIMLAACSSKDGKVIEEPGASPLPSTNPVMVPTPTMTPDTTPPDEPNPNNYPPAWHLFTLTDEENAVYERLKAELTTDVFEGLSPISVAKIYVQCGIDAEWEAEYICHSKIGLPVSLEDWHQQHIEDLAWSVIESRKDLADWQFALIDDSEVKINGDEAVIIYHSTPFMDMEVPSTEPGGEPEYVMVEPTQEDIEETYNEFHLIKNEKGIWEVRYRPFTIA